MRHGHQVLADVFAAPLRSSAARAALRGQSPLPQFVSGQFCLCHLHGRFVFSLQIFGGANKAAEVILQA